MSFAKTYIKVLVVLSIFVIIWSYFSIGYQVLLAKDIVTTIAPLTGKSSVRGFQEETNMTNYGLSSISYNYNDYLNWLSGNSVFSILSNELRNNFVQGYNPTNYALPYIDKDLLQIEFNNEVKEQIMDFNNSRERIKILDVKGEVVSVTREFKNFSTDRTIWGASSNFYDNTVGHVKSYDYDNYISYLIKFKVSAKLDIIYPLFNIHFNNTEYTYEFEMPYELIN